MEAQGARMRKTEPGEVPRPTEAQPRSPMLLLMRWVPTMLLREARAMRMTTQHSCCKGVGGDARKSITQAATAATVDAVAPREVTSEIADRSMEERRAQTAPAEKDGETVDGAG